MTPDQRQQLRAKAAEWTEAGDFENELGNTERAQALYQCADEVTALLDADDGAGQQDAGERFTGDAQPDGSAPEGQMHGLALSAETTAGVVSSRSPALVPDASALDALEIRLTNRGITADCRDAVSALRALRLALARVEGERDELDGRLASSEAMTDAQARRAEAAESRVEALTTALRELVTRFRPLAAVKAGDHVAVDEPLTLLLGELAALAPDGTETP